MRYRYLDTPIGPLLVAGEGEGDSEAIHFIGFPEGPKAMEAQPGWTLDNDGFESAQTQFAEYFAGERREFDLPLAPKGTPFQLEVWQALQDIPYGETCSYRDIAQRIKRPKAVRAVGAANGSNPLPIVVPCHRVIGSNGKLTGFGGGLPTKQYQGTAFELSGSN